MFSCGHTVSDCLRRNQSKLRVNLVVGIIAKSVTDCKFTGSLGSDSNS